MLIMNFVIIHSANPNDEILPFHLWLVRDSTPAESLCCVPEKDILFAA